MAPKKKEHIGAEREQRRLFKKKRGGQVLSEDEVQEIKKGRKKLRKDMKAMGIRSRREFELTASSMGLYFDRTGFLGLLWWMRRWGLAVGLGALVAFGGTLAIMSTITQMRGHFTISMDGEMFMNGFVMSETVGFENPTIYLFAEPATDVPCISISQIPANVDQIDGNHSETYFAYTFYLRNEGQETAGYEWAMKMNSETLNTSQAAWIMLFEDGEMTVLAKPNDEGEAEALPALDDNGRGYLDLPLGEYLKDPEQYETIRTVSSAQYYRVIPKTWESDTVVISGVRQGMVPQEVHKYTVVIWLEGDDPDCTDDLIGGNVGLAIDMKLIDELG